jgi:hypothetical protein
MEEQTKMEKNKAMTYMPIQKRKECHPPIAERVFGLIGYKFSFSKVT